MARTFSCNEEIIVVSKGTEDIGKLAMLGNDGKFDPSVIPSAEQQPTTAICRVSRGTSQSIPNNSDGTPIIFDTVEIDSDNMYDTANSSRIVIPYDGIYQIVSQLYFDSQGTGARRLAIKLNGSINISRQISTANGQNTWGLNCACIYQFRKGDYIELTAYQLSGGALNVVNDTDNGKAFLAIFKISD